MSSSEVTKLCVLMHTKPWSILSLSTFNFVNKKKTMCCQLLKRVDLTQRFAIIGYKAVVSKHQFHGLFRLFSSTPVILC